MNRNLIRNGVMILALLAAMSTPAFAKFYSYSTLQNATDSAGDPVWAKATFDVSAGSMIVTLTNLEPNIKSVGQNISSLWFTVNNGGSILSLSGATVTLLGSSSGTGDLIDIGTGGVVTSSTPMSAVILGTTGTTAEHWSAGQGTGTGVNGQSYFNDLNGGSQRGNVPQTIIGPPDSNGNYSTVNNSIFGNGPHNPFIQNQAVFRIQDAGLLANATVSNVLIGFGTTCGNNLRTVPEPGALALFAIGALGLAGILRKRQYRKLNIV